MKLKILSIDGTEKGNVELPIQFSEPVRKDLIKKVVTAIEANNRQPYGAKDGAGMRASAKLSRRRHDYRGAYGHGISRVPRKIMSRRGTRFNWVAAVAPGVVGGRRAHPPKADKIFDQKINVKENQKAIRSALAATLEKELVVKRGHKVPEKYPFVLDDSFEEISKTKELISVLSKLGFNEELARTSVRKIRAGKGKARGRRYKTKTGLLIVTSKKSNILKSISNIQGFEVVTVNNLNTSILAPGGEAGRIMLLTKNAVDFLANTLIFTENKKKDEKKSIEPKTNKKLIKKVSKKQNVSKANSTTTKKDQKNKVNKK